MLQRCTEIKGFSDPTDNGIADFLLARQNLILSELLKKKLTNVHSITLKLQKEDLSMADIRLPFEAVALRYPIIFESNAETVHSKTFKSCIVKSVNGDCTFTKENNHIRRYGSSDWNFLLCY